MRFLGNCIMIVLSKIVSVCCKHKLVVKKKFVHFAQGCEGQSSLMEVLLNCNGQVLACQQRTLNRESCVLLQKLFEE